MNTLYLKSIKNLETLAAEFLKVAGEKKHFAFYGGMGAGKTTFIKAICQQLEVIDMVSSPTFAIINEYRCRDNSKVFHFDFYRIKDLQEVYNLGYEDYFYGSEYCFIEWPELVEDLLPSHMVRVIITEQYDGSRKIEME